MARTDAIVLGAGIVGASVALHLVKRGLTVALVDRNGNPVGTGTAVNFRIEAAAIQATVNTQAFNPASQDNSKEGTATVFPQLLKDLFPWDVAPLAANAVQFSPPAQCLWTDGNDDYDHAL